MWLPAYEHFLVLTRSFLMTRQRPRKIIKNIENTEKKIVKIPNNSGMRKGI